MKIKFLTNVSSLKESYGEGEVHDVPNKFGEQRIAAGQAVPATAADIANAPRIPAPSVAGSPFGRTNPNTSPARAKESK